MLIAWFQQPDSCAASSIRTLIRYDELSLSRRNLLDLPMLGVVSEEAVANDLPSRMGVFCCSAGNALLSVNR